jgi:hypothetical protein
MKVKIATTVDIDPEAWSAEFGCEPDAVRDDVKEYFEGTVQGQLERLGLAAS